jgi:DNA-binding LytR/AlgR family response regulator
MLVHRSYVINVNVVSSLQYYAGGAYHVYLRNMPRNKIPVSASYVAALKIRLGIVEKGGKDKMADEENDPV